MADDLAMARLLGKPTDLNCRRSGFPQHSVDADPQRIYSHPGTQADAQTPEAVGTGRLNIELLDQLLLSLREAAMHIANGRLAQAHPAGDVGGSLAVRSFEQWSWQRTGCPKRLLVKERRSLAS
ncbi:MAG: hypothetical protein ACOC6F_00465 [bacterium]